MSKLSIEYASFFNRNILSYIDKKVIEKCNRFIYQRSGIYSIRNKINGDRYIGKSKNVSVRLAQHKSLLKNNHHTYRNGELSLLQNAWNKYGEDAFEFKIVEFCEVDRLNEREQYWIDFYKCNHAKYRQGYNTTDGGEGAYSNQNVKGRIQINNGEIQKMIYPNELCIYEKQGFVKGLLPETINKANINRKVQSGEKHWAYGKKMSEETKRKMSSSHIGKSTVWLKGKSLSNEHKAKLSKIHKGRKMPKTTQEKILAAKQKKVIQFNKTNNKIGEYISAVEAEKQTGVGRSHISQCCNGKRKTAGVIYGGLKMGNWKIYKNGNYIVKFNILNGTKIRETEADEFIPSFAENMDVKISNYCDMGCKFCHEGSTKNGKHGDILNAKFIDTLHPYQEVALGGGDATSHPDLIPFLQKLKEKKVICNITVNQKHFEKKQDLIRKMVNNKLIYGLGVSLVNPTDEFVSLIKQYPNSVIHVINGVLKPSDIEILSDKNLKMLILGYKQLRRGNDWYSEDHENIIVKQMWLKENLAEIINHFEVVSFDNLAIEQLEVQRLMSKEEWDEFYMGDDGSMTYFIDMVEKKFARSSTASFDKRYDLLDSVDEMFQKIRGEENV